MISHTLTHAQKVMEGRWHDLVIKEALGTITRAEKARLERHQKLRRDYLGLHPDPKLQARSDWFGRNLMKRLNRVLHRHRQELSRSRKS